MGTFLGLLLIIAITIIWAITESIQRAWESRFIFKGTVDAHAIELLNGIFRINQEDMVKFHFDGHSFHTESGIISHKNVSSIQYLASEDVKIVNPSLPHRMTWRHTRVSGGPDRRYKFNPQTRRSRKHTFHLEGSNSKLTTFILETNSSISTSVVRLNQFLELASKVDFEVALQKYTAAKLRLTHLEREYYGLEKRTGEIEKAIDASTRLANKGFSDIMNNANSQLFEEATSVIKRMRYLKPQIEDIRREISDVIQSFKDINTLSKHLKPSSDKPFSSRW